MDPGRSAVRGVPATEVVSDRIHSAAADAPLTLTQVGDLARDLAAAHDRLAEVVEEVRDERRRAVSRRMHSIRSRKRAVDRAWQALHDAIAANEPLFEKPRTRFRDGVRFGLRKGADKLSGDLDAAIERIERLMPEERRRDLVRVKKSLVLAAVRGLDAAELEAIGVRVVEGGDAVVIARTGDDLDAELKLIAAELPE